MSSLQTYLTLGRVSNLPTVWTNTLSACVLSGTPLVALPLLCLMLGFSLFYVAGMYLNDVCDSHVDAVERPERPIPSGAVARAHVLRCAIGLMLAGVACVAASRYLSPSAQGSGHVGWPSCTALLIAAIVTYNCYHKNNPCSALIMGACRVMLLIGGSVVLSGALPTAVLTGSALLFSYLIGLTWIARFEAGGDLRSLWPPLFLLLPLLVGLNWLQAGPAVWLFLLLLAGVVAMASARASRKHCTDIPRAVAMLIAGICLLDALLIAAQGRPGLAVIAGCGFVATLALQRRIQGT